MSVPGAIGVRSTTHETRVRTARTTGVPYLALDNLWSSGNLFFGLWLIPMGSCVLRSRWMPRALGWILIVVGAGYVLVPFISQLVPDAGAAVAILPLVATVGEFWMMGYLLVRGVNTHAAEGDAG